MFWPKPIRVSLLSHPSLPQLLTQKSAEHTHYSHLSRPAAAAASIAAVLQLPLLPSGSQLVLPSSSQLLLPPFQLPSLSSFQRLLLQAHRPADPAGAQVEVYMPEADVQGEVGSAPASSVASGSTAAAGKWPTDLSRAQNM